MSQKVVEENDQHPSGLYVGLILCFASVIWGTLVFLVEYFLGKELSGVGTMSTIIPAMGVGYFFGHKSGTLMPPKTRWQALTLWIIASFTFVFGLLLVDGISLYELAVELGWINLVVVVVILISMLLAYFVFKSGEKMAIKALEKTKRTASGS
ncbi:ABZJ_00895 family protein [Vibrio sp. IRLE0018]|uniref:ABZJ_00895 family protein n=1 Tax=Vibrio floridensis TaxID=2908007 RepID=UPI001F16D2D7|nr:ABZJ_00895 family protein [Vibrio floridensis]MCF8781117.1 ABZJ_00895 family protein [Vibrio floridensis]